jgi:hypothetical protein
MWKISDVMEVSIPNGVGYGFNVTTEEKKPLVLFADVMVARIRQISLGRDRRTRPSPVCQRTPRPQGKDSAPNAAR